MRGRRQRGTTLIELMMALSIILVAVVGTIGVMGEAARSTAVGHRRTVGAHLRTALVERMAVTPRDRLQTFTAEAWVVDACFDGAARVLESNPTLSADFECADEATTYRSWLRIDPTPERTWAVHAYAERVDAPCDPEHRYSALYCVAADTLLTD